MTTCDWHNNKWMVWHNDITGMTRRQWWHCVWLTWQFTDKTRQCDSQHNDVIPGLAQHDTTRTMTYTSRLELVKQLSKEGNHLKIKSTLLEIIPSVRSSQMSDMIGNNLLWQLITTYDNFNRFLMVNLQNLLSASRQQWTQAEMGWDRPKWREMERWIRGRGTIWDNLGFSYPYWGSLRYLLVQNFSIPKGVKFPNMSKSCP